MPETKTHPSEGSENSQAIEIVSGKDVSEKLTDNVLEHFAELLLAQTFHPVFDLSEETKLKLQNVLSTWKPGTPIPVESDIRSTQDWDEYLKGIVDHYKAMAEEGSLRVAVVNGVPAGIAGYEKTGIYNGNDVYEMAHVVVLPAYQKLGLSSAMTHALQTRIAEHDPDALLLTHTRSQVLIGSLSRKGAKEISPAEHVALEQFDNEDFAQRVLHRRTVKAESGMKAFLLPVRKIK